MRFRNFICSCVCLFTANAPLLGVNDPLAEPIENVTYEYLASNGWTNHVVFFKEIFQRIHVENFLEFGIGNSTKFFLENCGHVVSLELNAACSEHQTRHWFMGCVAKFSPYYSNWTPEIRDCAQILSKITAQAWSGNYPKRIPYKYLQEIDAIVDQGLGLCQGECSFAFVDSALFGRADIVMNLLARNIPMVAAHDTNLGTMFYRWGILKTPANYTLIQFNRPEANQLSVWIRQDLFEDHPQLLELVPIHM